MNAVERFQEFQHGFRAKLSGSGKRLADFELERAACLAAGLLVAIERADRLQLSGPDVDECRAELLWLAGQIERRREQEAQKAELENQIAKMNRGQRRKFHYKLKQKGLVP